MFFYFHVPQDYLQNTRHPIIPVTVVTEEQSNPYFEQILQASAINDDVQRRNSKRNSKRSSNSNRNSKISNNNRNSQLSSHSSQGVRMSQINGGGGEHAQNGGTAGRNQNSVQWADDVM